MKRVVLSLAIVAAMTMSVSAQNKQTKDRTGSEDRMMPMKQLNLTAEQEQQMKVLRETYQTNRKELNENYRKDMMKILTPEQQTKLQEMEKNKTDRSKINKEGKGNKSQKGKKGYRGNKNVDEATKTKLDSLRKDYTEKRSAILKSRIAPDVQKQQLEALDAQYKADRRAILQSVSADKKTK